MKRETLVEAYVPIAQVLPAPSPAVPARPAPLPGGRHLRDTAPIPFWPRPGDKIWQLVEPRAVAEISEYLRETAVLLPAK